MLSIAHPLMGAEEETAIPRVLTSGQLAQGEQVAAFEQGFAEVCQVQEAVAVSSGTAAFHLALLAHDIGPGDEVITTAFSFLATANAILLAGTTPIFVDIEPDTYNIDPALTKAAITPRAKAVLPVHLYGNPCDMKRLEQLATVNTLIIIEDACQAHATAIDGKAVGGSGTGCFSFYATKNITTGEGGMVTTNDPVTERLSGSVQTPVVRSGYRHVYHKYTIRVPGDRGEWAMKRRCCPFQCIQHSIRKISQSLLERTFMQKKQIRPRISVVIPALNEAQNLQYVLPYIPPIVNEVILVDGCSADNTIAVAQQLLPTIRIVKQMGIGKGDALRAGFAACTGDIVLTLDADGSMDPREIPLFIETLIGGNDFAKGSRFMKGGGSNDISPLRRWGNYWLCKLVNMLFWTQFSDLCYGYNAFWKHCLDQIEIDCNGFEVETLISLRLHKANLKIVEVPSFEYRRIHGKSKLNTFKDGWRILKMILRERSRNAASPPRMRRPVPSLNPITPIPEAVVHSWQLDKSHPC